MHYRNRVLLTNVRGHRKHFLTEMVWKKNEFLSYLYINEAGKDKHVTNKNILLA